jgi:hypothetical protein
VNETAIVVGFFFFACVRCCEAKTTLHVVVARPISSCVCVFAVIVQPSNANTTLKQHTNNNTMALAADEGWTKSQLMGGVEESALAATKKGKVCNVFM